MAKRFYLAKVSEQNNSLIATSSCENGKAYVSVIDLPANAEYPDGTPIASGDDIYYVLNEDGSLLPNIYPYGDPAGDPARYGGGTGRGHVLEYEQRPIVGRLDGGANDFGMDGRGVNVESVNGIVSNFIIYKVTDPNLRNLPSGSQVNFTGTINPDGSWDAQWLSKSLGDCDKPMDVIVQSPS